MDNKMFHKVIPLGHSHLLSVCAWTCLAHTPLGKKRIQLEHNEVVCPVAELWGEGSAFPCVSFNSCWTACSLESEPGAGIGRPRNISQKAFALQRALLGMPWSAVAKPSWKAANWFCVSLWLDGSYTLGCPHCCVEHLLWETGLKAAFYCLSLIPLLDRQMQPPRHAGG